MNRSLAVLLRLSLASVGILALLSVAASADASGAGALAVVLGAATLVAVLAIAVVAPALPSQTLARPRAQIDASALVAQSHPDAPGHSRPRAPGSAA